jgi:hypothetical protein
LGKTGMEEGHTTDSMGRNHVYGLMFKRYRQMTNWVIVVVTYGVFFMDWKQPNKEEVPFKAVCSRVIYPMITLTRVTGARMVSQSRGQHLDAQYDTT